MRPVTGVSLERYMPILVRRWLMREYPKANTHGVQFHGLGCPDWGPCANYCRCWCHSHL